ncbi:sulfotransferase domain-containing protein [Methyloligella solikamskensis]|uniref:Sulfotransferase domain-containing protein n=1 Tax=Methyloligella solikamskensis TaxID=1177756 RepID=A0ABW3JCD1_9HYPH
MWVIANGAPKNGSTWIFQLLKRTNLFSPLPDAYQNSAWRNESVADEYVDDCAKELGAVETRYTTKQHWSDSHDDLLKYPGIKVCNIIRDIRDVVVSRYHHQVRLRKYNKDISAFVKENGELYVRNTANYHTHWINSPYSNEETYYITSYEYLSADDLKAGGELFDFVGLPLDEAQRKAAIEGSRFENKTSTGPESFFRKGQAFGFADEISEAESQYLLDLASKYRFKQAKQAIAEFNPALRPYLQQTDLGL